MPANTNYNDPCTISRVISVIQNMNPTLNIGDYVAHAPSNDGRGAVKVQLTNGSILVTHVAIEDIDHAYEVSKYSDFMVTTFQSNISSNTTQQQKLTLWQRLLKFLGVNQV